MATFLNAIFGSKPKVAKAPKVDLQPTLQEAVQANIKNFPEISHLADLYSTEELSQLDKIIPGYSQNLASGSADTGKMFEQAGSLLSGEIPQDVQDQIQRSSAYRSLQGGFAGSPMASALTARDLGRTSLDLITQGSQLAGQGANTMQIWDSLARRDMLDPGSMFATPQLATGLAMQNAENKFNVAQMRNNIAAQRDPVAGGISDLVETLTAAYLGSMGGGMGGGGGNINNAPAQAGTTFNQGTSFGQMQQMQPYGNLYPTTNPYGNAMYGG